MPCGWEGNRNKSGVSIWPRVTDVIVVLHLRTLGLEKGDEHLPKLFSGAWSTLPYHTCTVVRGTRGLATTLLQGNQEPLVVRYKVGSPR